MITRQMISLHINEIKSYYSDIFKWARDGVVPYGYLVLSSFIAWFMCDKTNWALVVNATWK